MKPNPDKVIFSEDKICQQYLSHGGSGKLFHDCYSYNQLPSQNGKYQWKCSSRRSKNCYVKIWTLIRNKKHYIIEQKNQHVCLSQKIKSQIEQLFTRIRERIKLGEDAPELIVKSEMNKVSDSVRVVLPHKLAVFEILCRNDENDYDYSLHVLDFEQQFFPRHKYLTVENICDAYTAGNSKIHLLHLNYSYTNMNRVVCGASWWRCDNALKSLCMAKIYTVFEANNHYIIHRKFSHSCLPEPYQKEVATFLNNFKMSCLTSTETVDDLILREKKKWPEEILLRLPSRAKLYQIGRQTRCKKTTIDIDDNSDVEEIHLIDDDDDLNAS